MPVCIQADSFCAFCYKNIIKTYLSLSDFDGEHASKRATINRLLMVITRLENGKQSSFLKIGDDDDKKSWLGCCDDCLDLATSCCEIYHKIRYLELQLDGKLGTLLNVMNKAGRTPARIKKLRKKMIPQQEQDVRDCQGDEEEDMDVTRTTESETRGSKEFKHLQILRDEVMEKCANRLSHTVPRVTVPRPEDVSFRATLKEKEKVQMIGLKSDVINLAHLDNDTSILTWLLSVAALIYLMSPSNNIPSTTEICTASGVDEYVIVDERELHEWESHNVNMFKSNLDEHGNRCRDRFPEQENRIVEEASSFKSTTNEESELPNDASTKKRVTFKESETLKRRHPCRLCSRSYHEKEALLAHFDLQHRPKKRLRSQVEPLQGPSHISAAMAPTSIDNHEDGKKMKKLNVKRINPVENDDPGDADKNDKLSTNYDDDDLTLKKKKTRYSSVNNSQAGWVNANVWEVESVINSSTTKNTKGKTVNWYYVKWKGWNGTYNEWIPEEDFVSKGTLKSYWRKVAVKINELNEPKIPQVNNRSKAVAYFSV